MQSKPENLKDILLIGSLGLLIFFGALFIFVSIKEEASQNTQTIQQVDEILDKKINTRISAIEAKLKFKKNRNTVKEKSNYDSIDQSSNLVGELEVFKTSESNNKVSESILDETIEMVNKENESEEERRAYIESYKREYMRRAREDGWEVKLNDNLEVVSAKKIKPKK